MSLDWAPVADLGQETVLLVQGITHIGSGPARRVR